MNLNEIDHKPWYLAIAALTSIGLLGGYFVGFKNFEKSGGRLAPSLGVRTGQFSVDFEAGLMLLIPTQNCDVNKQQQEMHGVIYEADFWAGYSTVLGFKSGGNSSPGDWVLYEIDSCG